MSVFEIPLILSVEAFDRDAADDRASDVADAIGEVFEGTSAVAVISNDHNLLDRLGITYEGTATPRDTWRIT